MRSSWPNATQYWGGMTVWMSVRGNEGIEFRQRAVSRFHVTVEGGSRGPSFQIQRPLGSSSPIVTVMVVERPQPQPKPHFPSRSPLPRCPPSWLDSRTTITSGTRCSLWRPAQERDGTHRGDVKELERSGAGAWPKSSDIRLERSNRAPMVLGAYKCDPVA